MARAAEALQPGDTVLVHTGVYREWVAPARSGTPEAPISYVGAPGEQVVLTGADIVDSWERLEGQEPVYAHRPWTARFQVSTSADGSPIYHHPADEAHRVIGRPEQLMVDDGQLRQVLTRAEMEPGTFCADIEGQALLVWLSDGSAPAEHRVEASVRGWVFGGNPWSGKGRADHISLRNVTIRYAANHAQRGALYVLGDGWRIEDVIVEHTAGNGVSLGGKGLYVRGLTARDNGQMGMGGSPQGGLIADVKLLGNNTEGFSAGWEAGGMKFAHARDTVLSDIEAAGNDGPGIWFDIDNRDCIVRRCVCHDNTGHGIFIEISGAFIVTDNLCYANGRAQQWGDAGICIAESEDCIVEHNTCVGNPTGISVREQGPRALGGRFGEDLRYWVRNFVCRYNICAYNTEYQFGLWSDNVFFGPHPSPEVGERGTPLDPAAGNYRIDRNLYYAAQGQGLILWGCPWRAKHRAYADLASFTAEQDQDAASQVAEPGFADMAAGDFRLTEDGPARQSGAGAVFLR